jgi:hypothetical protein
MGSEPKRSLQNAQNCLHQYLPHPAGASFPAAARLSMDKTWVFSPAFFLHCYDLRSEFHPSRIFVSEKCGRESKNTENYIPHPSVVCSRPLDVDEAVRPNDYPPMRRLV